MLTERQQNILNLIKKQEPILGQEIAQQLNLTRSALRTDFTILKNLGYIEGKHRVGYICTSKERKILNIKDIMSKPLTLEETMSVYDAIVFMFEKDIGTIYITKDGNLSGVISRKDLLKVALGKGELEKIPLYLVMTRTPHLVYSFENEEILECARKIIEHEIDSIPIVREKEDDKNSYTVIGRITKTNITKFFIEIY